MSIDVRLLSNRDDALRLRDLVYGTYGLTYHRDIMYDPERLLERNRTQAITSLIAIDSDTDRVVGHLALIRPWFEIADPLPAGRGPAVVEVGLSIVEPQRRGQQVQNTLALAAVLDVGANNPELRGFYMKCLTSHPYSQRSARRFLGRATALFPAGVPAWVRADSAAKSAPSESARSESVAAEGAPTTTVLLHCPYREHAPREVPFPVAHVGMAEEIYGSLGLERRARPVRDTPGAVRGTRKDTRIATWFDGARRQGVVWVRETGGDLVEAALDRVRWLLGGHMEHITLLLPLDSDAAARAVPALEAAGMFVGGLIPDLEGVDTLVLERVEAADTRLDGIGLVGEDAERLRDRVVAAWQRSRAITMAPALDAPGRISPRPPAVPTAP
ncbi:MAG: hypothetical protein Q8P18_20935 [Pseudomonadota bacterium]|nr:hypothetical protein [Pseudomonadota bacterium]